MQIREMAPFALLHEKLRHHSHHRFIDSCSTVVYVCVSDPGTSDLNILLYLKKLGRHSGKVCSNSRTLFDFETSIYTCTGIWIKTVV